jgi:X-Pro dipeptidyl-peptidase (S15 family)
MRRLALLAAIAAATTAPATAAAAGPLGLERCADVQRVHQCSGLVRTWDGIPLDTTVTLPRSGARDLPLVVDIHGFGNSKYEYLDPASEAYTGNAYSWAREGYAVLTYTARGLWGSCGTPDARAADPACARGYIHLADTRYEVRDSQELIGQLVDEGVADARRIGVTGDSYGGGQSFALAALRDRVMLEDGRLVPWRSPRGTPLRIAAAAPVIPWTDLVSAIAPNGRTVSYAFMPQRLNAEPVGVFKTSIANAIFAAAQFAIGPGQPTGEPFVPGRPMGQLSYTDPQADVAGWVARADAGEPYTDAKAKEVVDLMSRFHSTYGIPADRPPPPLFVGSGFTDDLFPVDEVLRFVERMRRDHPRVPFSLLLGDFGHQRAQNKDADRQLLLRAIRGWFAEHLKGGPKAPTGVVATTQTCPRATPSEGPYAAPHFTALARGEVRYVAATPASVSSEGGDPETGAAMDPAAGGGDACRTVPVRTAPGSVVHTLPAAAGSGYTLLGSPTVVARLKTSAAPGVAQLALRLWDVAPGGASHTLVARGLHRPAGEGTEVFQLHPAGWRFAPGHTPRLEILGGDPPYGRPSNGSFDVAIERLELRLPVRDAPDCRTIQPVAPPIVPPGQVLAVGVPTAGGAPCVGTPPRARPARLRLSLRCVRGALRAAATARGVRIRRVDFFVRGRRVARDGRAPFARRVLRRPRGRVTIAARAVLRGGQVLRASRRARGCRRR